MDTNIHHMNGHCCKGFQGLGDKGQGEAATVMDMLSTRQLLNCRMHVILTKFT